MDKSAWRSADASHEAAGPRTSPKGRALAHFKRHWRSAFSTLFSRVMLEAGTFCPSWGRTRLCSTSLVRRVMVR